MIVQTLRKIGSFCLGELKKSILSAYKKEHSQQTVTFFCLLAFIDSFPTVFRKYFYFQISKKKINGLKAL